MRKGSSPEVANNQDWPEESPDQVIVDPPFGQHIEQPLTFDLSDAQREVLEKLGEWDMDGKTSVIGRQLGEALGVSPQKISYHTGQLEERGLIATQPDGRRKEIDLTEVMSGRRNLHVEAIGEDKQAISRIAKTYRTWGLKSKTRRWYRRIIITRTSHSGRNHHWLRRALISRIFGSLPVTRRWLT